MAATSSKKDPVPLGYRFGGLFFSLIAICLLLSAWLSRGSGWYIQLGLSLGGLGLLLPSLGMLFARTHDGARRAAAWLMLDVFLPI